MAQDREANFFELELPLDKAWQTEGGELWFEGVAASTALDRQNERMSPKALEGMARCAKLDLLPSHDAGAARELGVVDTCWVDENQFRVRGKLDTSNPEAWRLFEQTQIGKQYGLSVGGRVLRAHWVRDDQAGRDVRIIDEVTLDHVALCRPDQAANPETYLSVLAKAADAIAPRDGSAGESGYDGEGEDEVGRLPSVRAKLARVMHSLAEACRAVWPLCEHEPPENDGGQAPQEAQSAGIEDEIRDVRQQLEELKGELNSMFAGVPGEDGLQGAASLAKTADTPQQMKDGSVLCVRGDRQSLDGQERWSGRSSDFWKGVL